MGLERIYFGDELIGLAATSADLRHPHSEQTSQPAEVIYDTSLLSAAEDLYKARRKRDVHFEQFFGGGLFSEPAWDILLDLYINNGRKRTISVSSACLASAVPTTTALRYISELVKRRLVVRAAHPNDRRVFVLHLTALAVSAMEVLLNQNVNAR
jgi:DNA-binding MarR family transcriptional regulator